MTRPSPDVRTIYLVTAHDFYSGWAVKAFTDKGAAEAFREKILSQIQDVLAWGEKRNLEPEEILYGWQNKADLPEEWAFYKTIPNVDDPRFSTPSDPPGYYVKELSLVGSFGK